MACSRPDALSLRKPFIPSAVYLPRMRNLGMMSPSLFVVRIPPTYRHGLRVATRLIQSYGIFSWWTAGLRSRTDRTEVLLIDRRSRRVWHADDVPAARSSARPSRRFG